MVHFPTLSSTAYVFSGGYSGISQSGFPHSEIPGSKPICGSPGLIAAYRVLHRLLVPRHSPYTLSSLTIRNSNLRLQASDSRQKPARGSFMHTACVWSEKTTVCRIFSCQRTNLKCLRFQSSDLRCEISDSNASLASRIPRSSIFHLQSRKSKWRIPGSNR